MADDPIAPELRESMNRIAHVIQNAINDTGKNYGFALLVFEFGEGGLLNYIGNSNRHDMIKVMTEFINREAVKTVGAHHVRAIDEERKR